MVAAPRRGSISLSCCHSPPASLCAHSSGRRSTCSLTRRVTPDGSEQLARAPPPALCWPVFPPFFSFLSARRAGLFPPPLLTKPDPSLLADSCSPDQAAPGCMVVLRLLQRFNKCRKGRKVSVRCLLCASACMEGTFRVCLVCSATASYSVSASKATCPGRTRCCCNLAHYPGNLPLRP